MVAAKSLCVYVLACVNLIVTEILILWPGSNGFWSYTCRFIIVMHISKCFSCKSEQLCNFLIIFTLRKNKITLLLIISWNDMLIMHKEKYDRKKNCSSHAHIEASH